MKLQWRVLIISAMLPFLTASNVLAVKPDPVLEWKFDCGSRVYSSPVVADLTPDPGLEILTVSSAERKIICLSAKQKILWTYDGFTLRVTSTPTVADLDGDGKPEILIATRENGVVCLSADGSLRWKQPAKEGIPWGSATVSDVDRDGVPGVFWVSLSGLVECWSNATHLTARKFGPSRSLGVVLKARSQSGMSIATETEWSRF